MCEGFQIAVTLIAHARYHFSAALTRAYVVTVLLASDAGSTYSVEFRDNLTNFMKRTSPVTAYVVWR